MQIHTNVSLKNFLTMKLGGNARFMTEIFTPDELAQACRNAKKNSIPFFILGGGSNIVAKDEGFNGLVVHNKIAGFEVIEDTASYCVLKIGSGENWDDVVRRSVDMQLSGIEAMSAIPGTAGAAPVQNIGAYGQEIAESLVSLEAYDSKQDGFVTLTNDDCGFSYRSSIFRESEAGRYGIYSITLKLYKTMPQPPFYDALQRYLDEHSSSSMYSSQVIRDAIIAIRSDKLPDPSKRPNTGSFFKNAIIEEWHYTDLLANWPDMPRYDMGNHLVKVPTGWLIEHAGLKGKLLHGMRIHDKNCLVLINESATSYADLAAAREEIVNIIRDTYRIDIFQEPLEM